MTDEKVLPHEDIGDRLAHGLAARGVRAEAESIHAGDNEIGAALQQQALSINGSLLVMGSWDHSRQRFCARWCYRGYFVGFPDAGSNVALGRGYP